VVDRTERLVHVEERDVGECRAQDRAEADVDGADRKPDRDRRD
jgi:hypothetical protein